MNSEIADHYEEEAALGLGGSAGPDAQPDPSVMAAFRRPGLRLAEVLETMMMGYAHRPALGSRSRTYSPAAESAAPQMLPSFDTVSYGEVWSNVKSIAAAWTAGPNRVGAGDFLAMIGFASADYVTIDLVSNYLGLVSVPLPHTASAARLLPLLDETRPVVLAVGAPYLDIAVELALGTPSVRQVVVFDHDDRVAAHRAALQRAQTALNTTVTVEHLTDVIERGRELPTPRKYLDADDSRLAMILYTSGSTGLPKGAMWTERMVTALWTANLVRHPNLPVINVNFAPLNHMAGRSALSVALQAGGTSYFVAASDLSTLLEDWRIVRPTHLLLVPRVVDMLHQHYQTRLDQLMADGMPTTRAHVQAKSELREDVLGGRVLLGMVTTAPLSAEMREFVADVVSAPVIDAYGLTEIGVVSRDGVIARPPVIDYRLVDVPELGYFTTDRPYPRGELLIKSATAMPGYHQRPDVTAEVFDADGYYRTGDVVAEIAPDRVKYVDRRNNVLKLAQGEFVAIANLEAILAGAASVHQIFLYGNSERSSLLAVIVPTPEAMARYPEHDALKTALRQSLRATARAADLQPYEEPADFIVELNQFTAANGLLSGVGKLLRPNLKERYGDRLEELYVDLADARSRGLQLLRKNADTEPVLDTLIQAVQTLLDLPGEPPEPAARFLDLGGDSLSALNLSQLLGEVFSVDVPVGIIIGPATDLRALATHIEKQRASDVTRPTAAAVHGHDQSVVTAKDLALSKFLDERILRAAPDALRTNSVHTVLLTGANGWLGRFLAMEWLKRLATDGGRLITIVRGRDIEEARQRLEEVFAAGDATALADFRRLAANRLEVLPGDINEPHFGLDDQTWRRLTHEVDLIVHSAALVNHVLPYEQMFGPNVVGTAELIRLAISERIKQVSYLSTVLVAAGVSDFSEEGDIRQMSPQRPIGSAYANGYATSKWAGEVLLREAHELCGLPVRVFRADMILGHDRYPGQLNVPDIFTRMLISLLVTGLAPRTFYADDGSGERPRAHYDGLPVGFVAEAITSIGAEGLAGFTSFDVMNPHDDGVSLDVVVDWLIDDGAAITRIDDHAEWVRRFEAALRGLPEQQRQRSVLALLDAYRRPERPLRGATAPTAVFAAAVRSARIAGTGEIPHLDRHLIGKYITDLSLLGLT